MNPATAALIAGAKARREDAGLHVKWVIPSADGVPEREWSAYASSHAVKANWIASGIAKGWRLITDRAALAAEYVDLIGYDPFEDEPSISEAVVAQTIAEYKAELTN